MRPREAVGVEAGVAEGAGETHKTLELVADFQNRSNAADKNIAEGVDGLDGVGG